MGQNHCNNLNMYTAYNRVLELLLLFIKNHKFVKKDSYKGPLTNYVSDSR